MLAVVVLLAIGLLQRRGIPEAPSAQMLTS